MFCGLLHQVFSHGADVDLAIGPSGLGLAQCPGPNDKASLDILAEGLEAGGQNEDVRRDGELHVRVSRDVERGGLGRREQRVEGSLLHEVLGKARKALGTRLGREALCQVAIDVEEWVCACGAKDNAANGKRRGVGHQGNALRDANRARQLVE